MDRMDDLISRLSELRCQYNCFDKNEQDAYRTLSEAIKALSDIPYTNVGDTISRQAAIDMLEGRLQANGYSNVALVSELNRSIGCLMRLPSAPPKHVEWIPCSERLPEEAGQYLITVKYKHVNDSYEDVYAEHGEWFDGRWDMFCFGHCGEVEDIIAWMPLPEPYKDGEQDDIR